MPNKLPSRSWKLALTLAAATLLSACLSDEEQGNETRTASIVSTDLSGSVGDGPIVDADIRIATNGGSLLAQVRSDVTGSYAVTLETSTDTFPLLLEANGGTDIVTNDAPDFVLFGAAVAPSANAIANVNPFSTLAVESSRDMSGGVTASNLRASAVSATDALNSGLTSLSGSAVLDTRITESNVAEIVKASETLGETIRRTRDALNAAGRSTNADAVVQALASDLIDGVIEGNGGSRTDARISAVAILVHAQVLLESMSNQLHVNGINATQAMRNAIDQVVVGSPQPTLDQLLVTADMIAAASAGAEAGFALTGEGSLDSLSTTLDGFQSGFDPVMVQSLLPNGYRTLFNNAISQVASGSAADVATVNDTARTHSGNGVANRAPTISGNPARSVVVGSTYSFTPTASDLDGDTLTFSATGVPGWATFSTSDGRLTGTPSASNVGTSGSIVISVSDGELSASLAPFTITVSGNNTAPTISGAPSTQVTAGQSYSFTPTASDADNDTLTFSISGRPSWATFNATTGQLSGTPATGDVGSYGGIVISVSDGSGSASLPSFAIEVTSPATGTGTATLSWTPPTENEDGSPLTDLAGFRIYWGTEPGVYTQSATINNPTVTTYVVENLAPGTYEFTSTAFNSSGVESVFSNTASKTIAP